MSNGQAVAGAPADQPARAQPPYSEFDDPRGYGWVIFAGVMIMMAGTLNVIYGIAAISNSSFYATGTRFIFSDLKTWGWVVLAIGVLQMCVAAGIWAQSAWARWTGVAIASLNAIAQLIFIQAYPWLALAIFALDILVIYGLIAYGGRLEEP
jgi:hypothetical protein